MIYSKRTKPISLVIMESLERRTTLSRKHIHYLNALQKGFEGELAFDCMTEELGLGCIVINDLFLKPKMSNAFQVDTLIVIGETLYLYEIKNYSGEYDYGSEMLLKKPDFEISNPLIQVQSTKNKLKIFLKELGYVFEVKAFVVYVHPEFTLFHAPEDKTMILPTQLKGHFATLRNEMATMEKLPKNFIKDFMMHKVKQPAFTDDIPNYQSSDLKNGMRCEECGGFELSIYRQAYQCGNCDYKNNLNSVVLSSVIEYKQLFPANKLSTLIVYNWCNQKVSKKRIRRALNTLSKNESRD
ncbi:Nuclease-related domain-containing protein [Carnobacterium iners]|uniref:Nuclease-related domain-containing protein n=1 Tax=Carnobacterium iners TaxID=1073423 RepID=A0A1X7N9P6_9LACT|nr:nuclease-related domain-containing protein [Carnobacterium iners]SEK50307.1 Nuclease-related domain-containing protein [Carnobacterium iners]SMH34282.1 Nuclease-related domain-containing protein [Carnobacterium iners]